MTETEYTVKWEVQVTADSPESAARQAQAMQRDPTAMVGCFTVVPLTPVVEIDLDQMDSFSIAGGRYKKISEQQEASCFGCVATANKVLCNNLNDNSSCLSNGIIWAIVK